MRMATECQSGSPKPRRRSFVARWMSLRPSSTGIARLPRFKRPPSRLCAHCCSSLFSAGILSHRWPHALCARRSHAPARSNFAGLKARLPGPLRILDANAPLVPSVFIGVQVRRGSGVLPPCCRGPAHGRPCYQSISSQSNNAGCPPNPAEAHRRWRGERSKPVRLGVRDHHTRSLCA
jgi:hypothetical protein